MRFVLFAAAAIVATILGVTLSLLVYGPPQQVALVGQSATGEALIGGPFELVDHNGRTVTESVLEGKPHLVYFGYTYCPDFCPTELANMAAAADILAERDVELGLVFITVDPERDDTAALKEYVAAFHEDFIGLGGSTDQVAAAAREYRVFYQKTDHPDFNDYLVDHSTFVYAMSSTGRFMTHFGANTPAEQIAETIEARL